MLAAARERPAEARAALSSLCETYWPPLYAFLRRSGCSPQEAEDLVQGFFARLLEKGDLGQATPQRGRFRSFLLASLKHFLANQRDRDRAVKRGGRLRVIPLEAATAESRLGADVSHAATPDAAFDRQWAVTLLDRVRCQLREEHQACGKQHRFERLEPLLGGEAAGSYQDAARDLELSEGAVKVAVHRLRQRFGELLRAEIAQTVGGEAEIDDEIRDLFEALRR